MAQSDLKREARFSSTMPSEAAKKASTWEMKWHSLGDSASSQCWVLAERSTSFAVQKDATSVAVEGIVGGVLTRRSRAAPRPAGSSSITPGSGASPPPHGIWCLRDLVAGDGGRSHSSHGHVASREEHGGKRKGTEKHKLTAPSDSVPPSQTGRGASPDAPPCWGWGQRQLGWRHGWQRSSCDAHKAQKSCPSLRWSLEKLLKHCEVLMQKVTWNYDMSLQQSRQTIHQQWM
ncbi:unnamed protein product [Miscanthus lutarioriparius]|uniref:Uncharacterized protein n=1 Tax=Miscanthus lutarioriparius TaxID=422564 RepID=A0A811S9R0_9POAL|nr:unnamed protein product [Miscanthus lutarioriparius]